MENLIICDGTLSCDSFYISAMALCEQWNSANTSFPNWTWIPCKSISMGAPDNDGYLSLEDVYHIKSNEDLGNREDIYEEQPVDSATVFHVPNTVVHAYDFHITYSFSYRVPVLYFQGHQPDGQLLDLNDIQQNLPEYSLKLSRESKWTFITVEEHPYLRRPWYMLHPCGTNEWMKLLIADLQGRSYDVNYLVSWLSVIGQVVGLRIPAALTSTCFKVDSSSTIGEAAGKVGSK